MRIPIAVMVLVASQVASADTAGAVTPVFSQLVSYSLPNEFRPAFENSSAGSYIQEFVPEGETVEQWSQMITLTGARDKARDPAASLMDHAASIGSQFSKACPDTLSRKVVGTFKLSGYDGFVVLLGCGTVRSGTPRSEIALVVTIRGKSDIYTLQWAERSAPINQAPVLDDAIWGPRFQQLNPIRVCDRTPGDATPYPSCTATPGSK